MQAGAGDLADGVKAGDAGLAFVTDLYSTALIMCGRYDGDRLLGDVEAEPEAGLVNVREPVDNGASRLVGDVEQHMVVARALHLAVDRAGHDVAWGE